MVFAKYHTDNTLLYMCLLIYYITLASIDYNLIISNVTYNALTVTNVNPMILTIRLDWEGEASCTCRTESTANTETIKAVVRNQIF